MSADRLGKYELVRHLASGGMASVYLARISGLGGFERHVVLKTLRSDGIEDDTLVPMFLDEARLVATLHHQHIAQVFEVGVDDNTYFLAMEYVHGETVRHILETARARARELPLDFGLTVVCAAAAGLHHAHERRGVDGTPLGIVHRDVTPSNVIVSYGGSIKLIDFGIAKAAARSTVTRTGLIKGKVGYMAPEQVRGYPVDRRSDVFALGVLAYELTTQARAFDGASQFEQLERTAHSDLVPPSKVVPGYPQALEEVVMTALELDPDDRYPTADAMRFALTRVARELGLSLGEASAVRLLEELYGCPPEPWLVPLAATAAITPSIETPPFAIARVRHPLQPDPGGFARGTSELASIDDSDDDDDDEVITDPIDLPVLTLELETVEPQPRATSRAATVPLAPPLSAGQPPALQARPIALPARVTPAASRAVIVPLVPLVPPARAPVRLGRRATIIGGSVVCALAVIAAVVVGVTNEDELSAPEPTPTVQPTEPPDRPVAALPLPPPPAPPPDPAPSPAPDQVTLRVITDPPDATVVLDGVRLGRSPYLAEVPIKRGAAWLKVRKAHHVPVKIRISLERDVTWNVRLRARR